MKQINVRNFAIVAHIDHGKSTLADRLMEYTGTVTAREQMEQLLDSNPIERERGITIKLAPVRMTYKPSEFSNQPSASQSQSLPKAKISETDSRKLTTESYILNLIDTPGHVDFSYEVSRSLAACEGILLVVDSAQGIQAQTLAHMQQVKKRNLPVIPILNKIDLPAADIAGTKRQLQEVFGFTDPEFIEISAKTGKNIEAVLDAVIKRIPAPSGNSDALLRGLVFSSVYDQHRGVVVFVRIVDGCLTMSSNPEYKLRLCASNTIFHPIEIGIFTPKMKQIDRLQTGMVGYIATGLKDANLTRIGDTLTVHNTEEKNTHAVQPLPGYQEAKPMVFMEVFPIDTSDYTELHDAIEKLNLSDSAFSFTKTSSKALGHGFHCGFLGLLHAEVVMERLDREFDVEVISTIPSVEYHVTLTNGKQQIVQRAEKLPDPSEIASIQEPIMMVTLYTPKEYVGNVMQLTESVRGQLHDFVHLESQARFVYTIPLSEMIVDFFDRLKGASEGYASLDYEYFTHEVVDAVRLDILINKEPVDALSLIVPRIRSESIGRHIAEKLKNVIPRQQFEIPIQASIGGKIIARETVKAFRKDVTQKLYGGDRSRKDKLLKKQKKGKKKMKMIGRVEIPQSAFLAVLKR